MITVYVKTGCPYCAKVLETLNALGLDFEEKNIADPGVSDELREVGGKHQVPYMNDDNMTPFVVDDDVAMYESEAIIAHLKERYGEPDPDASPESDGTQSA